MGCCARERRLFVALAASAALTSIPVATKGWASSVEPTDTAGQGVAAQVAARAVGNHSNGMEALLRTIRYAEGTWKGGSTAGYRTLYGGGSINDYTWHPGILVVKYPPSDAAGAYQFKEYTWNRVAQFIKLRDFSPAEQDRAAVWLVRRRLSSTQEALIDQGVLSLEAMAQLAPEWAAFPLASGGSYYGQPVKSHGDLQTFFAQQLAQLGGA